MKSSIKQLKPRGASVSRLSSSSTNEGVESVRRELDNLRPWSGRPQYIHLLKQCTKLKAAAEGRLVQGRMKQWALDSDPLLCNFLVQMYGNCGCLPEANAAFTNNPRRNEFSWTIMLAALAQNGRISGTEELFHRMPQRNVVSWNSMIAAYSQHGYSAQALALYSWMNLEGVEANDLTLLGVLDACSTPECLARGRAVHERIVHSGFFMTNPKLRNAVVSMYGKCESVQDAKLVFDSLPEVELVSWNTMVAVYGQNELLEEAKQAFDKMPVWSIVSWNGMLAAFVKNGRGPAALELFKVMEETGISANLVTFVSVLDVCSTYSMLEEGRAIHGKLVEAGLESEVVVATLLVNMYGNCGCSDAARAVFESINGRNVVLWNAMIAAYAHNGCSHDALQLLRAMDSEGFQADTVTLITVAGSCNAADARILHSSLSSVLLEPEEEVAFHSALVGAFIKSRSIPDAVRVFEAMPSRNVVSWNSMLSAFAHSGRADETFRLFQRMDMEGFEVGVATVVSLLDACSKLPSTFGNLVYSLLLDTPLLADIFVSSSLVHMYGKCGDAGRAKTVFDSIRGRNVVTWTALLTAYSHNNMLQEAARSFNLLPSRNLVSWNAVIAASAQNFQDALAFAYFRNMVDNGLEPDESTFTSILDSSSTLPLDVLRLVHSEVCHAGYESDHLVATSLVKMYARCGSLEDAVDVFAKMPLNTVASWNAIVAACGQNGQPSRAVHFFQSMDLEGVRPNVMTYVSVVDACSQLGARVVPTARDIHQDIMLESDAFLANALINMYGKCGLVDRARQVFDRINYRSLVSWTSMVEVYGSNGDGAEASKLFRCMHLEGVLPDDVAFVCIISSLSHSGEIRHCIDLFISMQRDFGIQPSIEHYACMVDVLGRAGRLDMAGDLVHNMPLVPNPVTWTTLLSAYTKAW